MKFSIRDLLLLTVILALAVGWWVDRSRLAQGIHEMQIETIKLVLRRQMAADRGLHVLPNPSAPAPNPPQDRASWQRQPRGE